MQELEKILKEIDAHAIEFEMFGISDDYISVGWVKEIIRNHMNDRWFLSGCNTKPQDKQLCVVVHKYGGQTSWIYQYRKADWLHPKNDYFLDVSEKWNLDSLGIEEWNPSFMGWWGVDRWKPLGLPADVNERVLTEIEKWFDEDEG